MGNIAIIFQFISMICLLAAYIGINYEVKQLKEKLECLEHIEGKEE